MQVGLNSPEVSKEADDGKTHHYFAFLLQLTLLCMLPHILAKAYFIWQMHKWPFRKVKKVDTAIFAANGMLVLVTTTLMMAVYHAGSLMIAVNDKGFVDKATLIIVYCYLFYWSSVGFFLTIVGVVYGAQWLYQKTCCRSRSRRNAH